MVRYEILSFALVITILGCNGFRVNFDFEDTWEENDDLMSDAKYQSFQLIFPGTKWCGTGNVAENYDDLGSSAETDMCCREHDLCDDIIEAGQTRHNLTNNSFYTRLNCKCDETFYDCLKSSGKRSARAVGTIYFDVLGTQCYRKDYPIVNCIKYHHVIKNRCIEYEFDESQEKIYEWFDVPPF